MSTVRMLLRSMQRLRALHLHAAHSAALCKPPAAARAAGLAHAAAHSASMSQARCVAARAASDYGEQAQLLQLPTHCSGCGIKLQSDEQDTPG
jgi:hypothetical protein